METLKQFALDVHNFAYRTKWDDEDIVSAMDFDGIIKEMKKDENELNEEIEKLKEEVDLNKECYKGQQRETDIEHVRYLDAIQKGGDDMCSVAQSLGIEYHGGTKDVITEIKKLKKEIEELKNDNDEECGKCGQLFSDETGQGCKECCPSDDE
jgi:vacuolar-type H+-ATPase subunit H